MFEFVDIQQNTDEWFNLRAGKLTSSKLGVIMAQPRELIVADLGKCEFSIVNMKTKKALSKRYKSKALAEISLLEMKRKDLNKSFGEPAKHYAISIAIEQITGKAISSNYTNNHMQRGHDQEPIARMMYEDVNFCDVDNGGFFQSAFVGCSPDGLVSSDGVVEIKSVIASTQFSTVKRQNVDPAYKWQCVGNLKFTGRSWIDYVSYCSDFPDDNQLFVHRLKKDDLKEEFKMLDARISLFKNLVEESKNIMLRG